MVTLNIEHINAASPYKLTPNRRPLFYDFITDYGIDYNAGFTPSNLLPDIEAYEFVLTNPSNRKSPRDPKLRQSILTLVYEFFRTREAVMLYLCETGDNRQKHRSRLFESWFRASGHQTTFAFLSTHGSPSSPNNSATQSNCSGTTSRKTSAKTKKAFPSFAQSK